MKSTGIVRGIDNLGRIVLPKELRTSMKLETDSKLEIFVEGDQIILKKYRAGELRLLRRSGPQCRAVCGLLHLLGVPQKDRSPVTKGETL